MEHSLGREKPESERPVLDQRDQPAPAKGSPPPPFIVVRRGGVHEWEHGSRRFPLNHGVQWSDTVGSVLWEGSVRRRRPGFRPWPRGDGAGHPAVPRQ